MFTVRYQFRNHIKEQDFCSETQAVSVAYQAYNSGCWQYVTVISHERDESIIELGMSPKQAYQRVYA